MKKNVLIIGTTTGLVSGEKLAQEKAIYVTLKSFRQAGYQTILLTENRELFPEFRTIATHIVFQEVNLNNLKTIILQYQIDFIFPAYTISKNLNIFRNLIKQDFLQQHHVKLLVLNKNNLNLTISHKALTTYLQKHGFRVIEHKIVNNLDEAMTFVQQHHFPIIIRVNKKDQKTYWNSINTIKELAQLLETTTADDGYEIERSINNFKELTMTTIRDRFDNSALIYSSEDLDSIGINSNDSISVAPVFSLNNDMFQRLRNAVLKLTRLLKIVGICTFDLAVDEQTNSFYVLTISPLFQGKILPIISSTGYPLFEAICQVSIGHRLEQVKTLAGPTINAAVELTSNHITARFPIWQKYRGAQLVNNLGPHTSSLGAVIVSSNNLESVIMKGLKILDLTDDIFINKPDSKLDDEQIESLLFHTNIQRIIAVCEALDRGFDVQEVQSFTKFNLVFLETLKHLLDLARLLEYKKGDLEILTICKRYGFSDFLIARLWNITTKQVAEITTQLSLNCITLSTSSSFSLNQGSVNNYFDVYLDDPQTCKRDYQIILKNYPNSDMISNYEMSILAYQLLHQFQTDGYSVASEGYLLSKIDSSIISDYYTDSDYNKSYLYKQQNRLNITINTLENHHMNYPISIYNLDFQRSLFSKQRILTEISFIQNKEHKVWLSLPITSVLKKNTYQHWEINAVPGKLNSQLVHLVTEFVNKKLSQLNFGTLIIIDGAVVKFLSGFTTNIGVISQVNPNFIDALCHSLVGIAPSKSQKSKQLFGRKINFQCFNTGLYTTKVHYFDLPASYRRILK